jgi:hypothetical protein
LFFPVQCRHLVLTDIFHERLTADNIVEHLQVVGKSILTFGL